MHSMPLSVYELLMQLERLSVYVFPFSQCRPQYCGWRRPGNEAEARCKPHAKQVLSFFRSELPVSYNKNKWCKRPRNEPGMSTHEGIPVPPLPIPDTS